jgi:hypothetical protein
MALLQARRVHGVVAAAMRGLLGRRRRGTGGLRLGKGGKAKASQQAGGQEVVVEAFHGNFLSVMSRDVLGSA